MATQSITNQRHSNVARVEYEVQTRKLTVYFKNAITYLYTGFPPLMWNHLSRSRNIGYFVHDFVMPVYRGRRLRA